MRNYSLLISELRRLGIETTGKEIDACVDYFDSLDLTVQDIKDGSSTCFFLAIFAVRRREEGLCIPELKIFERIGDEAIATSNNRRNL